MFATTFVFKSLLSLTLLHLYVLFLDQNGAHYTVLLILEQGV